MNRVLDCPIPSPVGELEGLLSLPEASAGRAVVVCHPHPLHGGTMHSHVVFHAARALRDLGFVVLRFNFRGVGRSPGRHDHGLGEQADVTAALDLLAARYPDHALWVCGYSFGSWVGMKAGDEDGRVRAMVGIGMPVDHEEFPFGFLAQGRIPVGVVQGSQDEYGSPEHVRGLLDTLDRPSSLHSIPGADHFFAEHLPDLREAVTAMATWAVTHETPPHA